MNTDTESLVSALRLTGITLLIMAIFMATLPVWFDTSKCKKAKDWVLLASFFIVIYVVYAFFMLKLM